MSIVILGALGVSDPWQCVRYGTVIDQGKNVHDKCMITHIYVEISDFNAVHYVLIDSIYM